MVISPEVFERLYKAFAPTVIDCVFLHVWYNCF